MRSRLLATVLWLVLFAHFTRVMKQMSTKVGTFYLRTLMVSLSQKRPINDMIGQDKCSLDQKGLLIPMFSTLIDVRDSPLYLYFIRPTRWASGRRTGYEGPSIICMPGSFGCD